MKLQHTLLAVGLLFTAAVYVQAAPAGDNQELDVLQIPLTNGKELDVLTLGARDQEQLIADRNKRTIGLLRELFPDITKEVDLQIDRYVNTILRLFGPTLLGTVLNPSLHQGGRRNFTALNEDDDAANDDVTSGGDDDDETTTSIGDRRDSKVVPKLGGNGPGQTNLTVFQPDEEFRKENGKAEDTTYKGNGDASDTQIDLSAINKQLEETIRVARQVKEAEAALQQQQQQSQTQPQQYAIPQPKREETIQLSFNNEVSGNGNSNDDTKSSGSVSNELQLSESKSPAIDELTLDSAEDTADLDDRNKSNLFKRFLSFGGGAGLAGGSSGGSGGAGGAGAGAGGSGNFLFDIVRLFSGSVQTQAGDEAANSVAGAGGDSSGDSDSTRAADGYTEAIPGPVTRLVVLANRGLANLIQDLILRVAATSEKFVNFKAKLITALI